MAFVHPRLRALMQQTRSFLNTHRGRRVRRVFGALFFALALLFLITTLVISWEQLRPHLRSIEWRMVAVGCFLTLIAFLLGGIMWFLAQRALGLPASLRQSLVVHVVSNATKYMPGYGWQYMSKAYLSRGESASAQAMGMAIGAEFLLLMSSGFTLATGLAARFGPGWEPVAIMPRWVWSLCALTCICGTIIAIRWLQGQRAAAKRVIDLPLVTLTWLVGLIGWCFFSGAVWFFARALLDLSAADYWQCTFALVGAGTFSILVIFVPGGFGVREGTLALLLVGVLPLSLGIIVGILARLGVMASEILGLLIVSPYMKSLFAQRALLPNGQSAAADTAFPPMQKKRAH